MATASTRTLNCLESSNAQFAVYLYQRQASESASNIFISPLSISLALAMTYLGARANTRAQMRETLRFDLEDADIHKAFEAIQKKLTKADQPYKLFVANRLFGEKSYSFLKEFLDKGREHYGAELAAVDFRKDANGAAGQINSWVAANTNQLITDLVDPSSISPLTRLILINAIYFKGSWAEKFDFSQTKLEDFHVSQFETVKVPMMAMYDQDFTAGHSDDLSCAAVELPYNTGLRSSQSLSMYVILPDSPTGLPDLEKKLTADVLTNIRSVIQMRNQKVKQLWLPRFKLSETLDLTNLLASLGMSDLFAGGKADLSGIDGTRELFVSAVLHRAVVEVNEEGTEAAAATQVRMMLMCARISPPPFVFKADHPFLFFIRDQETRSILFLGRVMKPTE